MELDVEYVGVKKTCTRVAKMERMKLERMGARGCREARPSERVILVYYSHIFIALPSSTYSALVHINVL